MKRTIIFFTAMAATMFLLVIGTIDFSKPRPVHGSPPVAPNQPHPVAPQPPPTQVLMTPEGAKTSGTVSSTNAPGVPDASNQVARAKSAKKNTAQTATPAEPLRDPLAREALAMVGLDGTAEEYWLEAINDPTLSAHERQDLIEDLNEVGFADPDNPTVAELPLIVSRLQIIEENAASAMDETNAAAFEEAYKDLWNMYARLTRE